MRLSTFCGLQRDTEQEDECKWFFTAIWFILLKQVNNDKILKYGNMEHCYCLHTEWRSFTILHTLCTMGPSCHAGLVFQSLPGCSMRVLSSPLLLINCLSCSPLGGPGPPPFPYPISLRVHAPSRAFVGYNNYEKNLGSLYIFCCILNLELT